MWQIGFWNLLLNEISIEAYHLILDTTGYNTNLDNWNSYDAILELLKYFHGGTYFKVNEGLDSVPKKMANLFIEIGGHLSLNTRVISLESGKIGDQKIIKLNYEKGDGQLGSCYAKNVTLALPKRAIELLDKSSFIFSNPGFVCKLKTVTPQHASKVFLWYDQAWWTKLGFLYGPSRTDLPLRQCYYFGLEHNPPKDRMPKGLLMASYSDGVSVDFWEGYFNSSAYVPYYEKFTDLQTYLNSHRLPEAMVEELTSQLSAMHSMKVPKAHTAIFQDWV